MGGEEELARLLARSDVDAVSVVLASHLQAAFVEAALKAGDAGIEWWQMHP